MRNILILVIMAICLAGCSEIPVNGTHFHLSIENGICIDTADYKTDILIYNDSIVFSKDKFRDFYYIFYINGTPLFMKERGMPAENQYQIITDRQYRDIIYSEFERCLHMYPDSIDIFIIVSVTYQQMILCNRDGRIEAVYPVSTSAYGTGSRLNSNKTPLGAHIIRYMTGDNVPSGGIFKYRQYIGEIANIYNDMTDTEDDFITSRIMHLDGIEESVNSGSNVDSYERHIYIHGTHEEGRIGIPSSHGCIRMVNSDVIELYNRAYIGMPVIIIE